MPTITALKTQRNNNRRVNIHLNGTFAFGLATSEADSLRVGEELTEAQVAELRTADEVEKAYKKALNYISYRPRTEKEVRQRLEKVKSTQDIIESVIVRLREVKLVDDEAFAAFWVENRTTFRPRGHRMLMAELRHKGIDQRIIETAIACVDESAAAADAANRRGSRMAQLPDPEFRRKLRDFLGRRGFKYDVITMVVDEIVTNRNVTKEL